MNCGNLFAFPKTTVFATLWVSTVDEIHLTEKSVVVNTIKLAKWDLLYNNLPKLTNQLSTVALLNKSKKSFT